MAEKPVTVVCVGMAGSGKTTFMQRIISHLHSKHSTPYVINLDPAVHNVPFSSNIDIRDSVNYREVMTQYNLGPNGGIMTSLNLFATKIDQIIGYLERWAAPDPSKSSPSQSNKQPQPQQPRHIVVDTPGQIEVFVWSASGAILLDSLASSFPTVVAYIIDTPRTTSTSTFMSNMLYACSILYKTKLPMILVCNKTDVQDAGFVKEWMTDFEAFQKALKEEEDKGSFGGFEGGGPGGGGSGYMGSLLNSMSMVLEEFYRHLSVVPVSSMTGEGTDEFFEAVKEKAAEYERDYRPELERKREERTKDKKQRREKELGKLMKDMNVGGSSKASTKAQKKQEDGALSDMESDDDMEDDDDEDDGEDDEDDEEGDEEGLQKRYKKALETEGGGPKGDEHSFKRYLNASSIGQ